MLGFLTRNLQGHKKWVILHDTQDKVKTKPVDMFLTQQLLCQETNQGVLLTFPSYTSQLVYLLPTPLLDDFPHDHPFPSLEQPQFCPSIMQSRFSDVTETQAQRGRQILHLGLTKTSHQRWVLSYQRFLAAAKIRESP